jgi:nucleoside-diphosphate-sugar epimerase
MRILMTGASGPKVGSIVAEHLGGRHELVGVDAASGRFTRHVRDINDLNEVAWRPLLEGIDAVVHFAALHAPHRQTHSRNKFIQTNVDATSRLLDAARRCGVRRFLLASSTSVYGRAMRPTGNAAIWVTEALVAAAEDIYDETKLAAEQLCREAFAADFVTASLRFSRSFPESLPSMALYRLYRGVDARDVAQAFTSALEAQLLQFEALNISAATPFLQGDCQALFADAPAVLQQRCPAFVAAFAKRGWPLPQSIDRVYAIDRAREVLGFAPAYSWQQALATAA